MPRATRAIVDLSAIEANFRAIQARMGAGVGVCPAVKANAYGHGAVAVATTCEHAGATMLAVATPAEAYEVRSALRASRILMFGGLLFEDAEELVRNRIELTISNETQLTRISEAGRHAGCGPRVHINVDTGMGRIGVHQADSVALILAASQCREVGLASVYTHFPASDEADRSFAREQISRFTAIVDRARGAGAEIPLVHMANSGAILDLPESYADMVRPGMMLYGCYPAPESSHSVVIRPALKLVSRLVLVREVPAGWTVSYGRSFTARRRTRLGIVPAGYADGLPRALSDAGKMAVRNELVPIIGRVCMDLTMLDLTDLPGAEVGDEVVIYSDRRADPNSVENVAQLVGTIPNDIVCAISARVERVHCRSQLRASAE